MNNQNKHSDIINLTNAQRIRRACSVIIPLCFLSLFIALFIASAANDIYAFVKPKKTASVEFSGADSVYGVARELEAAEIINDPLVFTAYVRSKKLEERVLSVEGSLTLDSSMSYREILKVFSKNQKK